MGKRKSERWSLILSEFRDKFPESERTLKELQSKWDNMKRETKKKISFERREMFKTGGGVPINMDISHQDNMVMSIVGGQFEPLPNPFDSDKAADQPFESNISEPPVNRKMAKEDKREELADLMIEVQKKKLELLNRKIENEKLKNKRLKKDTSEFLPSKEHFFDNYL